MARPAPRAHAGRRERIRRPAPAARTGPRAHADRAAGTRRSRRPRHRRTRPPSRLTQAIRSRGVPVSQAFSTYENLETLRISVFFCAAANRGVPNGWLLQEGHNADEEEHGRRGDRSEDPPDQCALILID